MGVDVHGLRFLARSRKTVSFDRFLMLGRQFTHVSVGDVKRELSALGLPADKVHAAAAQARETHFFEPVLEVMGARQIDSMDFSDYEQATIVHDINYPIADNLKGKFTCVHDGGTLEHVFNFPTAIRNAMEMVAVGGHFLCQSPTNNLSGHGFYQFSPDLYWRIFSDTNGFEIEEVSVCETQYSAPSYRIEDPSKLGRRVMFTNSQPTYMMVRARKVRSVPVFETPPQQTYYEVKWSPEDDVAAKPAGRESLRSWAKRSLPAPTKNMVRYMASLVLPSQVRSLRSSGFKKI